MAYTGGELNKLNGDYGISAPEKSVPVMKLIRIHKPKSKDELCELIKYHHENNCKCGIKSKGTIEMFGKMLYDSQFKEWKNYKYSLQECIQWEYDLFILQSLKGNKIEDKAKLQLSQSLKMISVDEAEGYIDEELRIDLIISKKNIQICGIQVKPLTFKYMRSGVINFNKTANEKWGKPVFYLYYDESENFSNFEEIILKIKELI